MNQRGQAPLPDPEVALSCGSSRIERLDEEINRIVGKLSGREEGGLAPAG